MSFIQPLRGVRVIDFSKVLAGPTCTQALADYGADVIKIEDCRRGDDTRGWPPFRDGDGAVFLSANRNKRSVAIDLKSHAGRAIVRRLCENADVVIESFGPGVAQRLGIDPETLSAVNPRLIHCSISGYGRSGPLADAKGYDMILQAFCGMVSMMGEPGGGAVRAPYSPVDQGTGMHATSSILAALLARAQSGRGCRIEVSLFDTGIAYLGYMLQSYWERGTEPQRFGCAHESLCPYQVFAAKDKPVLIGVASEPLWRSLCDALGLQSLVDDPRFRTNADRVRHRDETVAAVQAVIGREDSGHWERRLLDAGVPCAGINTFGDVLAHPHTRASGIVMAVESADRGALNAIAPPVKFDGSRAAPGRAAPRLGEHTREVLAELGLTDAQQQALLREGVVAMAGTAGRHSESETP